MSLVWTNRTERQVRQARATATLVDGRGKALGFVNRLEHRGFRRGLTPKPWTVKR